MKVKIFNENYINELEKHINEFIEKIEKDHMEVVDIKYSIYERDSIVGKSIIYNALVMYKPDGIVRLDLGLWEGVPEIRDGRS